MLASGSKLLPRNLLSSTIMSSQGGIVMTHPFCAAFGEGVSCCVLTIPPWVLYIGVEHGFWITIYCSVLHPCTTTWGLDAGGAGSASLEILIKLNQTLFCFLAVSHSFDTLTTATPDSSLVGQNLSPAFLQKFLRAALRG